MSHHNEKRWHFIYKTVNLTTGEFYCGMHSTNDIDDDYLGSGTRLANSLKAHGRASFRRDIIEHCATRGELAICEALLVNEDMLRDPLCMNLIPGGSDPPHVYTEELSQKLSESHKGLKHTTISRKKMQRNRKGKGVGKRNGTSNPVKAIVQATGLIETYDSVNNAAKTVGCSARSITSVLGTQKFRRGRMWSLLKGEERELHVKLCRERKGKSRQKAVQQYSLEQELITTHLSTRNAAQSIGLKCTKFIVMCIRGQIKSAYGFIWRR